MKFFSKLISESYSNIEANFRPLVHGLAISTFRNDGNLMLTIMTKPEGNKVLLSQDLETFLMDIFGDRKIIADLLSSWLKEKYDIEASIVF